MLKSVEIPDKHIIWFNAKPVGVISVQKRGNGEYYLGCLGIIPEYQHRGIGTQAVKFALAHYSDWTRFSLCTPEEKNDNVRFYHDKLGFAIVGSNRNQNVVEVLFEKVR